MQTADNGLARHHTDDAPNWWPDWTGQTAVIAASGPSLTQDDLNQARGRARVVVINNTYRLAPWADVLYACDDRWWKHEYADDFDGLKIIGHGKHPGCREVSVRGGDMVWHSGYIGGGGNSGFQALNLVARWGAAKIILLGYDHKSPGNHWHGRHPSPLTQTSEGAMRVALASMERAAPQLKLRTQVINCTRDTAINCFDKADIRDVFA